jgi:prepilin-type N-terminal cleavage/methylation domain-containing protein
MSRSRPPGFTLVELLVVLAIMGLLLALLLPAIQKAREASQRTQCQSQLRQLAIATWSFQDSRGGLPIYQGIYDPVLGGATDPSANPASPYGSWFLHLLPYVDENALYQTLVAWCAQYNQNTNTTIWVSGTFTSGTPAYWNWAAIGQPMPDGPPGAYYDPGAPASQQWQLPLGTPWSPPPGVVDVGGQWGSYDTSTLTPTPYNGHPGVPTFILLSTQPTLVTITPATPGGWRTSMSGPLFSPQPPYVGATGPGGTVQDYTGVWGNTFRLHKFPLLLCPSDYSYSKVGFVAKGQWGGTSYLPNWWVFGGDQGAGVYSTPGNLAYVPDGHSQTILYSEAFAECDNVSRRALLAWDSVSPTNIYHTFGLAWAGAWIKNPGDPVTNYPNGMPNTYMFQLRPLPKTFAQCPAGANCCDNWVVQTPHPVLNVAMADGSIKTVTAGVSSTTWSAAMQPNDGTALGPDW